MRVRDIENLRLMSVLLVLMVIIETVIRIAESLAQAKTI
jgi:hypothetical protein